jgi:hypothetical protein
LPSEGVVLNNALAWQCAENASRIMKKQLYILLILSFIANLINAQDALKGHYFEASTHLGSILKHRSFIRIETSELPPTLGAELSWEFNTFGRKYWHQMSGFPRMGVALSYQNFRDTRLGWAVGIMPHMTLRIFKYKRVEMFSRIAMGFAYVSNHFDSYSNPDNNIIGSHINNNTGIRFGFDIEATKKLSFRPSFSFTHYSNAASQQPNLGINVMSFHLGVLYKHHPLDKEDYKSDYELPEKHKGPTFCISTGVGVNEIARTYRGPKYPVIISTIEGGLFLSRNNRLKLGFTHEYHPSKTAFWLNNGGLSRQQANWDAQRFLFFVGDEVLLGHLGLTAELGYYFYNAPLNFPFTRIGVRVYPLDPMKHRLAPYIGIRLKSHNIVAEFFDVTIGCAIQ